LAWSVRKILSRLAKALVVVVARRRIVGDSSAGLSASTLNVLQAVSKNNPADNPSIEIREMMFMLIYFLVQ
jgi:hypothetical protein